MRVVLAIAALLVVLAGTGLAMLLGEASTETEQPTDGAEVGAEIEALGPRLVRLQVEADWATELRLARPLASKWAGARASAPTSARSRPTPKP